LAELLPDCQVLQISGKKLFEETRAASETALAALEPELRARYRLVPYMDAEMPMALQGADLVLCRAGAATLSELAALGKPTILVPLPPALGSSPQEANAAMFERRGAAGVIRDEDLKPQLLVERVKYILSSNEVTVRMVQALGELARPEATREIADAVMRLAGAPVQVPGNKGVLV
jgi:UDP-N-acetylglucosamine--N-acetylmuramyl-(pentapeptide) pyrophosphoryl-undecaprenol N-acetylglucosamine transferase